MKDVCNKIDAILRLFNAYIGKKKKDISIHQEALKYGILIDNDAPAEVVKKAIEMYGIDKEFWNNTLYNDFYHVAEAPIEELVAQQLLHYFSTYGLESLGLYDASMVYIPAEVLNIPELDVSDLDMEKVRLIHIYPITKKEVTKRLLDLVMTGIALSEKTVKDITVLASFIPKDKVDDIVNREVKTALYDYYKTVPTQPEDFLRYVLYKVTGRTLKIQNQDTIKDIKTIFLENNEKVKEVLQLFQSYQDYDQLSSIFLRNKNLFLAFKTSKEEIEKFYKKEKCLIKKRDYLFRFYPIVKADLRKEYWLMEINKEKAKIEKAKIEEAKRVKSEKQKKQREEKIKEQEENEKLSEWDEFMNQEIEKTLQKKKKNQKKN